MTATIDEFNLRLYAQVDVEDIPFQKLGYVPHAELERAVRDIDAALRAIASDNIANAVLNLSRLGSPALAQLASERRREMLKSGAIAASDKAHMEWKKREDARPSGSALVDLERSKMAETSS